MNKDLFCSVLTRFDYIFSVELIRSVLYNIIHVLNVSENSLHSLLSKYIC